MEYMAASLIRHGVTKSGSPTPRDITSSIVEIKSKNLRIPEGERLSTFFDIDDLFVDETESCVTGRS
jgi:hypothetical protein